MKKTALFVFNGDPMCFIHVVLNALDMHTKGEDVKIIVEGAAVKLVPELVKPVLPDPGKTVFEDIPFIKPFCIIGAAGYGPVAEN